MSDDDESGKLDMAAGGVDANGMQKQIDDLRKVLEMQMQVMTLHTQAISTATTVATPAAPSITPLVTTPVTPSVQVKNVKAPEGRYEMNSAELRTFVKDCHDYKKLTKYSDEQLVLQLRLNMDAQLKRAIDTNFPTQWNNFSLDEAIKGISSIVEHVSNPAVVRKDFDSMIQNSTESIREFTVRLKTCALDCNMVCPFEATHDLTEYHIISRIRCGVRDKQLQQELLQKAESLTTLRDILDYSENFESAKKDREKLSQSETTSAISGIDFSGVETEEELVAAISNYRKSKRMKEMKETNERKCGSCGYDQHNDRLKCPAQGKTCSKCKRPNHFAGVCRTKTTKNQVGSVTYQLVSTVEHFISSTSTATQLPKLTVNISVNNSCDYIAMDVIADTGAQVILAGTKHMKTLGLQFEQLIIPPCELKHVGGSKLDVVGSHPVQIHHNNQHVEVDVHFAKGIENIYLSLDACRKLHLVHESFPNTNIGDSGVNSVSSENKVENDITPPRMLPNKPDKIPYPPTEENIPKLKQWLLDQFSSTTFNTSDKLPMMSGAPHHIHLKEGASPYAIHSPIPVPHHWKAKVRTQLETDVETGIIQRAPLNEPTEWCTRMVTVAKKDGEPRRTNDYQVLNGQCSRETHHTPSPFDVVSSIPQHQYKTVLDAFNGYHQVPLDEDSVKLTTFITEFGRFQNLRTPQGLVTSGDAYTRRYDDIIRNVERKVKIVDDSLLYDVDITQSFWHTFDYLTICGENGITLNPRKLQFCQREVEFVGFKVGWDSFKPSDDMVAAIKNFPMPESPSLTDIRSWYGLVNQLAPFIATSPLMSPFRDLLKPSRAIGKKVYWDEELQKVFEKTKVIICELIHEGLSYYDTKKKTILVTDWSKSGIAFVVMQKHCSCPDYNGESPFCCTGGWKISFCNSRYLHPKEMNFSPIEGEALAVSWALKKARMFLQGNKNFDIVVDHKPLLKIFGDKSMDAIDNPILFQYKEKTLPFTFTMKYIKGIKNCADVLSRYPANKPDVEDCSVAETINSVVIATATRSATAICISLDTIHEAVKTDKQYQELRDTIQNASFADTTSLELPHLREFHNAKDRLSITDDLIFYGFDGDGLRVLIPKSLRRQIILNLHSANQGSTSMLARARQTVYWPGIDRDITHHTETCLECRAHAPSQQKEPLITSEVPDYPFQKVVADLFQIDNHFYVAYVDRLTGFAELAHFPTSTSSSVIINVFREFFHRWGAAEEISVDGGPNLVSKEIKQWFESWKVDVRLSSAYYPQSNGRAEAGVKSLKRLLRGNIGSGGSINNDNIAKALLQYRNTPLRGVNKSPAQLALGRHIRDTLPLQRERYKIDAQWAQHLRDRERKMNESNEMIKQKYDLHAKTLKELNKGDEVLCQNERTKKWDKSGIIVEVGKYRQYSVKMNGSGRISLRNRRHLKKLVPHAVSCQSLPTPIVTNQASDEPDQEQLGEMKTGSMLPSPIKTVTDTAKLVVDEKEKEPFIPRRSSRRKKPPTKYHDEFL